MGRQPLGIRLRNAVDRETYGGLVYFIRVGRMVKIGFTINLPSRFSALATAMPKPPELLLSVMGLPELEKYYHYLFESEHSHREWFHLRGVLKAYLQKAGADV